jgi:acyl-coenzyme A thioesterase PaaI-like protein
VPRWTSAQWQQLVSHVVYNNELGVEFSELVPTGVVLRIRYRPELATSVDDETLNDGAVASMVDAALGFSVHWAMPDDRSLATLDMRIDRLRAPRPRSDVFCRATCVGFDEHVAYVRGEIFHDRAEDPFAIAVGTIMFIAAESWMRGVQGIS